MKIEFSQHQGTREYQEDAVILVDRELYTIIGVADGMGGHLGGKEMSQACQDILDTLGTEIPDDEKIREKIKEINHQSILIFEDLVGRPPRLFETCPASTLTIALIEKSKANKATVYHLGDSFCFTIENKKTETITKCDNDSRGCVTNYVSHRYGDYNPVFQKYEIDLTNKVLVLATDGIEKPRNFYPSTKASDLVDFGLIDYNHFNSYSNNDNCTVVVYTP